MTDSNNRVKILVIAPYIGLVKLFEEAAQKFDNIELTAYESDTTKAVSFIKTLSMNDYDIIISRGYTCKMIREACGRHVLDVGISIYDVLRTIRLAQNYNGRFAVVGFHSIIYYAIILKDILRYEFDIFTLKSTDEIESELNGLKDAGYNMIVGDVVTTQTAKSIGLQTMLITTSPESVDAVLNNSLSLYEEQLLLKRDRDFYKDLICGMDEGTVVYDQDENLLYASRLQNTKFKNVLKKSVASLYEKKELHLVKTIENNRFLIHGKVRRLSGQLFAVFYFKIIDNGKKDSGLLRYYNNTDTPFASQRTFYTLSPSLKVSLDEIKSFQFFQRPVFITGPRGSGKDSFALFLHQKDTRKNRPMVIIDCRFAEGREWEYLINHEDSPLFSAGYTIFIKDIHHLNKEQLEQLFLLICNTALNKRNQLVFSYVPGISSSFEKSDLKNEIIYILHALVITIPSLNNRREDIPNLASLYLNEFNSQMVKQAIAFEPEALKVLQDFNWTDNLYQMKTVIQELIMYAKSSLITAEEAAYVLKKYETDDNPSHTSGGISLEGTLDDITKRIVNQVLREENMNQSKAAKRLNIGRSTLRRHL